MRDLPTGTVTLLFTDIEGSTKLLDELGDAYADLLAEHRCRLREAFRRHGGVEVDTQGDAFFYAFPMAADAVAAAEEAQRVLAGGPVQVRMGLHTGEPTLTEEGYVGVDVHRAARIMGAAHGGQVVVSETTRGLVDSETKLRSLGEHRLKDVGTLRLYQLGTADFPPLRSLNATNLPSHPSLLLGRKKELAEVLRLISDDGARLVTVTGPGGVGKTRFALEAGAELVDRFPQGVWLVDLSPLRDPAVVLPTIASTLGVRGSLEDHLSDKELLLVLDNFEQVIDAAGELARLLASSPAVRTLVTSREPLRIGAEREYGLRPLGESPAVELFRQRAAGVDADFEAAYDRLVEICDRLDRLPLALELAASRIKVLPLAELAGRLEQRLPLLTTRARDLPERQRTLRATIEWSYELCSPQEQSLFGALGVFVGGWSSRAAEEICGADLDLLESLLDRSLVRRDGERFTMLETIREFAAELTEEPTRRRHAEYFLRLAESANLREDAEGESRLDVILPEQDNLRAALRWTLEHDAELGLRLAVTSTHLWVTNDPREGMRWFQALLAAAPDAPLELRSRALRDYGGCANPSGDDVLAEQLYEESLAGFRELGDEQGVAHLLMRLAHSAFYREDPECSRTLAEESLGRARAVGDKRTESLVLGLQGELEFVDANVEGGMRLIERAAELALEAGFIWQRTRMLRKLVDGAVRLGRLSEADAWCLQALALSSQLGDRQAEVFALARLARIALERGEAERAGRFWGAVEAEEERGSLGAWHDLRDQFADPVLGRANEAFEHGRREGFRLGREAVVRGVLARA